MNSPTESEVRQAIESSGYPLEIRVAHTLVKAGFFEVTPSWDFRDDKTGESREIDVAAWRAFEVKNRGTHCQPVMLNLLFECKRSPAFVMYSAHPRELLTGLEYDAMSLCYFGRPGVLWKYHELGWSGTHIVQHLKLGSTRWRWPQCVGTHYSFIHSIKDQAKLDPTKQVRRPQFKASEDDFYQRKLLGLLKGTYKYREPYINYSGEVPGLVQPHFVIPVLVLDADLYEYDVEVSTLRRIKRAAICRSYQGEFSARFRVDVVEENDLVNYLQELERDFRNIALQIGREQRQWQAALNYEHQNATKRRPANQPATAP